MDAYLAAIEAADKTGKAEREAYNDYRNSGFDPDLREAWLLAQSADSVAFDRMLAIGRERYDVSFRCVKLA